MKENELVDRLFLSSVMSKHSSLLFTVEQWELARRLRLSGLSKEQVCQAFDDLEKMEKDLSYLISQHHQQQQQQQQLNNNLAHHSSASQSNELFLKNFQLLIAKNLANLNQFQQHHQQHQQQSSSSLPNLDNLQSTAALNIVNSQFAKLIDPEQENKEIDEFKLKGEVAIHSEISFFVYKHDLKQSQISRMAGVNQAYVSKFLRGEFYELSENGKSLIYKWYLRFLKNPNIFLQAHKISLANNSNNNSNSNTTSLASITNDSLSSLNQYSSFATNVTNIAHETPKRTRFSFKPEHLAILENAFSENQYPDQKKREEITKLCNGSRNCSEREKVTEQVITHWFQNKRKITRKLNSDDSTKSPVLNPHLAILNTSSNSPLDYASTIPTKSDTSTNEMNHSTSFLKSLSKSSPKSLNNDDDDSSDEMY